MQKLAVLSAMAVLVSACGINEDNFPTKYAKATCRQSKVCEQGQFDSRWEDMGDCIVSTEEAAEEFIDFFSLLDCELDPPAARRYLSDVRSATCEEFVDSTFGSDEDVFECGGG